MSQSNTQAADGPPLAGRPGSARYCDDPDNCTYADCPTAFCDRNSAQDKSDDIRKAAEFAVSLLEGNYVVANAHRMGALGAGDLRLAVECLKGALRPPNSGMNDSDRS